MKKILLISIFAISLAACHHSDNTTTGGATDSKPVTAVTGDTTAVTPTIDTVAVRAEQARLDSLPAYRRLREIAANENKNYPQELLPGLQLVSNYIEGHEVYYMYFVNENVMDFNEILSQRDEMREAMREQISNAIHEKGNKMGEFVRLCVESDVQVKYLFKGTNTRRTLVIRFTPPELQAILNK